MALILDTVTGIVSPPSLVLFDDTTGRNIWYAPKDFRLHRVNGRPAISYAEDPDHDIAFLQTVFAPWFDKGEFDSVANQAQAQGKSLNPVRYLGKDESSTAQSRLIPLLDFPDDPKFRFKVNGGLGGFMANPIPLVMSMNLTTGRIVRNIIRAKDIGMVLQFGAVIKGATTSFEANVYIDYDRCYQKLSVHASVSWWIWSSDWQAAWQELSESGSVRVEILGGTADQKAIVYKTMEYMRDIFFKPEVAPVTTPSHPGSGIIRTSVQFEKIHEHKVFKLELRERDFTDAPYNCAAFTEQQDLDPIGLRGADLLGDLFEFAVADGTRVMGGLPMDLVRAQRYMESVKRVESTGGGEATEYLRRRA